MQLTGPQVDILIEAIGDAFVYATLEKCLRTKLDRRLDHLVGVPQPMPALVYDLLDLANREGWVEPLLSSLTQCNPKPELHDAVDRLYAAPSAAQFLDAQTYSALVTLIGRDVSADQFRGVLGELGRDAALPNLATNEDLAISTILYDAVREGWIDPLLQALAKRDDAPLGAFAAALLAGDQKQIEALKLSVADRDARDWNAFVSRPEVVNRQALEKTADRFVSPDALSRKLAEVSRWICRIESTGTAGSTIGTGFLVAPDLVLTCRHVVPEHAEPAAVGSDIRCRFDFRSLSSGAVVDQGTVIRVDTDWLFDSSGYDMPDDRTPESAVAKLNYALIRLARRIGDEPVEGESGRRGWFDLSRLTPMPNVADVLSVISHPEGGPLKLSIGQVIGWDESGSRLVHDAITLPGSGGGACLNANFELIGLHEGKRTLPGRDNLAVSLDGIVQRMRERSRARGLAPFWEQTPPAPQQPSSP